MSGELAIDRLLLEVPGLDAERARRLAECIAAGLAGASGEFPVLSVRLDEVADEAPEAMAARIVAALRGGMG
jgi:hypothetical protein